MCKFSASMVTMKTFFAVCTIMIVFSLLSGCFLTAGNYLYVEGKGDIALVSFSLDRRIFHENDSTHHDGPALLESKEAKETWWDYHKQAINSMYRQFRDRFSTVFTGTNLVDHQLIADNEAYKTLTLYKSKVILGQEVGLGFSQINPDGLNWVSGYGKEKLDSLCDLFKVNLAMSVDLSARWHVDTVYEEPDGFAMKQVYLGHMILDAQVFLHEKSKGMVWSGNYRNMGAENLVNLEWSSDEPPQMNKQDFPAQLENAFLKIYPRIIEDVKRGKMAMQQKQ